MGQSPLMHPKPLLAACADLVGMTLRFDHPADAVVAHRFRDDPTYLNSLTGFDLTVANLTKGPDSYPCETPVHAKVYEEKVTEALKALKNFIMGNASKAESKSFEL